MIMPDEVTKVFNQQAIAAVRKIRAGGGTQDDARAELRRRLKLYSGMPDNWLGRVFLAVSVRRFTPWVWEQSGRSQS
jgi:hypothetical protein